MATDAEVRKALEMFPGASEEKIQKAMKNYGVSSEQLNRVRAQMVAPVQSSPSLGFTGKDAVEKTLENTLFSSLVPQGAIQVGPAIINPVAAILQAGYNLYKGLSDRQKAESQKRDNLFYLTLDEMRKAGEDPYEQYPEDLFDVSQYPEFAGIAPSGSPEEMRRETINAAIYNWRERNQDIVQQAYDAFLRSGLDYDEYKKRLEEGEPVEEEEVITVETDVDLTPQQTFEGLEEEQKIVRINDALENNPNASLADILDILTSWNIPTDLFRKATGGLSPEEYVAATSTDRGTDGGDGGTDGGTDGGDGGTDGGTDGGDGGTPCPTGYVYDEASQSCVPIKVTPPNGGGDGGKPCPTGYHWDEASQSCVKDAPPPPPPEPQPDGGLNGPVETPQIITQLPKLTEAETATGGMFAAFAASPTRTTSEVLAPDLFKLDVNIPLVQRLTQYSPTAAPQYLLSGISQRYKV